MHRLLLAAVALLVLPSGPVAAWDAVGHRVVAAIAWEEMTPTVRQRAVELLLAAPADSDLPGLVPGAADSTERGRELFVAAATWPDIVRDDAFPERRERYHHSRWHYINYFWDQSGPGGTPRNRPDQRPASSNIVERLEVFERSIGDRGRPASERGIELAWVLHLVGDIHQPLHTSARITDLEPEGDRGGNLFYLAKRSNLHWYWDGILRRSVPFWWSPDRIAAELMERHPKAPPARFDPEGWAKEGFATAKAVVYPADLERERKPSRTYRKTAYTASSRAIARAGYRLAALLNRSLDRRPPDEGGRAPSPRRR